MAAWVLREGRLDIYQGILGCLHICKLCCEIVLTADFQDEFLSSISGGNLRWSQCIPYRTKLVAETQICSRKIGRSKPMLSETFPRCIFPSSTYRTHGE
ncbi:hypothetical protein K443DRAFT_677153 [Laccaria amethystina LaAM-08-1]|uniref:Unplaced genomic scaffold K443scaffold_50, whole genome shotgun sequence n=1 Tax=Laccaria amethystina LaAM-08-1 TaxID=1095629 RepID=A0A0C9XNG5_9AGAR|nr:hypothetical protein K443DRAFT_677153 [Laccaria amethystina LaAM-08-1]